MQSGIWGGQQADGADLTLGDDDRAGPRTGANYLYGMIIYFNSDLNLLLNWFPSTLLDILSKLDHHGETRTTPQALVYPLD